MASAARRHRLMIWGASWIIVAAAGLYATYLYDWLRGGAPERPRTPSAAVADAALKKARVDFRAHYLDCVEHLRLAEALYRAGRPVDAFYVMYWARSFFGDDAFMRAHSFVVLYQGRHVLGDALFDASAAGDKSEAVKAWVRLAAAQPGTFGARGALEELGRLAQGPGADADAVLAREALEELWRGRPQDPLVFSTLAMAAWQNGGADAARALVAEALSRRPGQAGALMVQGALALNDRDVERAIHSFTAAWEKNPDDLYSAAKLAQLYFRARADAEAALPFYIALYRANPRYDDGEPAQQRIREILDSRREAMLSQVRPEGLGHFLSCNDASLRAEAAVRAAQAKDPRWIETLADLLDDDTEIVRHNADYALYQIGKGSARDALRVRRDEWLGSEKPLVRARALNLFADLDPKETFPLVLKALKDPEPAVRFLTRAMVLDHYYQGSQEAAKARAEYLSWEKDPQVLALPSR